MFVFRWQSVLPPLGVLCMLNSPPGSLLNLLPCTQVNMALQTLRGLSASSTWPEFRGISHAKNNDTRYQILSSIHPSIHPISFHPSIHPSIYVCLCVCVCLFVCLVAWLLGCLFVCLFGCLFLYSFVPLFLCFLCVCMYLFIHQCTYK